MTNPEAPEPKIPKMICVRVKGFEPLLAKWRRQNVDVPWGVLLRRAMKRELASIAGVRHAHLVKEHHVK